MNGSQLICSCRRFYTEAQGTSHHISSRVSSQRISFPIRNTPPNPRLEFLPQGVFSRFCAFSVVYYDTVLDHQSHVRLPIVLGLVAQLVWFIPVSVSVPDSRCCVRAVLRMLAVRSLMALYGPRAFRSPFRKSSIHATPRIIYFSATDTIGLLHPTARTGSSILTL